MVGRSVLKFISMKAMSMCITRRRVHGLSLKKVHGLRNRRATALA